MFERQQKLDYYISKSSSQIESLDDVKVSYILIRSSQIAKQFQLKDDFTNIIIGNLSSLGLVKYDDPEVSIDNGDPIGEVNAGSDAVMIDMDVTAELIPSEDFIMTNYGLYFIKKCKI